MSPFIVGIAVFFLAGAACVALYLAITPQNRAVDERFADLAVKMRASQGALEGDDPDDNVLRMLFRWAAKRVPPPNMDSPTGEKLQQTLAQAGFLKSIGAADLPGHPRAAGGRRRRTGYVDRRYFSSVGDDAAAAAESAASGSEFSCRATTWDGARACVRIISRGSSRTCSICWWYASRPASGCSRRFESWAPNASVTGRKSAPS